MARIRSIKPEFPQSESMGRVSRDARLTFILCWSIADDAGRLRGNPRMLASTLFPYDVDAPELIGDWLDELEDEGCIVRYSVAGAHYVQIVNWREHQKIDKPSRSHFPAPPAAMEPAPDSPKAREDSRGFDEHSMNGREPSASIRRGIGREGKGSKEGIKEGKATSPSVEVARDRPPDDPAPPIVDQIVLIDSPEPAKPAPKAKAARPPDCPHQAILALWAEVLPALPQHEPGLWAGTRADHLRSRWRETAAGRGWQTEADGLAYFRRLFGWVGESRFLTGREQKPGRRPFQAELAWLVSPQNWAKVIEGKYHDEVAA